MPEYFMIAGAQRSGTTFLYDLLDQHPEIEMARPLRPEPKFFLVNGALAQRHEYEKLFEGKAGAHVRGEKSTSYMERGEVAAKAVALLKQPRAVFVLRDPVERALSNYRFSLENGVETKSFEYALQHEQERIENYDRKAFSVSPYAYLSRGLYARLLDPWESALGRRGMYVMSFEELIEQPHVAARRLYAWLGVSADFEPNVSSRPLNASKAVDGLDPDIAHKYGALFHESNLLLARRYGLDIGRWQSSAR